MPSHVAYSSPEGDYGYNNAYKDEERYHSFFL